ncbi:beta-glucosidase [Hasllibacter halocynthiae]|uniref:Beta-glucosidase n=2 Tax=Hasllibacter halocynthiae TaxID=595589 RepID=A0A2T0X8K9_9RHOB|nr:beta-glucosidase [Hasllibacter halocynthiae]
MGKRMTFSRADLPEGFVFGTATSAYQIEGHRFGGAGPTHWDSFAATPGNVVRAEDGATACDHYHRWEEDLDLVRDANFDAYRFSTSWARVMPDGRTVNPEGLDFYDRLVDGMLERGIKPALTLYHWELPSDLSDRGGWTNADMPGWFGDFAEVVARRIGDRVWSVAPINEMWCVAWLSHFLGEHAPGLRDVRAAARAVHHVLASHGRAVEALRGAGVANVGAVCNFEDSRPADASAGAAEAAARYHAIYNLLFLQPLTGGGYPDLVLEGIGAHLPRGWEGDMKAIAAPLDWFGVNYYTRRNIAPNDGPWPHLHDVPGRLERTAMGWEIWPQGLKATLELVAGHVDVPIYVTENGMAAPDEVHRGEVRDPARIDFLNRHVDCARAAMDAGVDLRGYFVWSLLDNYEWALGYEKRFGLVHVDFESLERTPKTSWHAMRDALRRTP